MTEWKRRLTTEALSKADLRRGRQGFNTACAPCHTLYGEGGKAGPDLTGGGRANLDYLLENIVDPSASVSADFRMSVLELKDGRVLNAVVLARNDLSITAQTMTESVTLARADMAGIQSSELSLMPDGLLDSLAPGQAIDLIAYLMHPLQVPVPESQEH
jgi:putative heme-binding domain-containing protein